MLPSSEIELKTGKNDADNYMKMKSAGRRDLCNGVIPQA